MMSDVTQAEEAAPPQSPSLFQTLGGVILRPQSTFETMRQGARSYWWLVLVIAALGVILLAVGSSLAQQSTFAAMQENLPEGADVQLPAPGVFQLITAITGIVGGLVGLAIGYLLQSGIVYGLSLALGGRSTFRQIFQMSVWTRLPDAIRGIVQSIAVFVTGNLPAAGLSGALTAQEAMDMRVLDTLLGRIDLYLIWSFVLLAMGMSVTARLSRGKGFLISAIYFLISIGAGLAFAAATGALASSFTPG